RTPPTTNPIPYTTLFRSRPVNTGAYALNDEQPPPGLDSDPKKAWKLWQGLKAQGIYLDNFGDIQFPNDRRRIKSIWKDARSSDRSEEHTSELQSLAYFVC